MTFKYDYSLDIISDLLLKLGYLTKNIQMGKQTFLQQNYGAQRVKKIAHKQQAFKNVEIKKGKISFVKKNYKGNLETLKKHQNIPSFY